VRRRKRDPLTSKENGKTRAQTERDKRKYKPLGVQNDTKKGNPERGRA